MNRTNVNLMSIYFGISISVILSYCVPVLTAGILYERVLETVRS